MMFFQCKLPLPKKSGEEDREYPDEDLLRLTSEKLTHKAKGAIFLFVENIHQGRLSLGFAVKGADPSLDTLSSLAQEFMTLIEAGLCRPLFSEITFSSFEDMLRNAAANGQIEYVEVVLKELELTSLRHAFYHETLLDESPARTTLLKQARELLSLGALTEELQRIFAASPPSLCQGHPVHYTICASRPSDRDQAAKVLIQSLYRTGRLTSRRCSRIIIDDEAGFRQGNLSALYEASVGGSIILEFTAGQQVNCFTRDDIEALKADAAGLIRRYQHEVLTILSFIPEQSEDMALYTAGLSPLVWLPFQDAPVEPVRARRYLKKLAGQKGLPADEGLLQQAQKSQKGLTGAELHEAFSQWYSRQLRTQVFPQYVALEPKKPVQFAAEDPLAASAMDELQGLIGLSEAKDRIEQIVHFEKAQKLFRHKDLKGVHRSHHMIFTGNPGTAKTTTARLYARILKENGILSKGDLIEATRADLVGQYVGWTARTVKSFFEKAAGSVLFIDEAYALVDDKRGLYGDEAINTIVYEMENRREDLVVVFAGYPKEMEWFLETNPGLRSRITHHVSFPDYSPVELLAILEQLTEQHEKILGPGVKEKVLQIFGSARSIPDFGNGRYVRNLYEAACMAQATRILKASGSPLGSTNLRALLIEDFSTICLKDEPLRRIGFQIF